MQDEKQILSCATVKPELPLLKLIYILLAMKQKL